MLGGAQRGQKFCHRTLCSSSLHWLHTALVAHVSLPTTRGPRQDGTSWDGVRTPTGRISRPYLNSFSLSSKSLRVPLDRICLLVCVVLSELQQFWQGRNLMARVCLKDWQEATTTLSSLCLQRSHPHRLSLRIIRDKQSTLPKFVPVSVVC